MIDRLEISVLPEVPLTRHLSDAYSALRRTYAKLYKEMIDLRQIRLPARLLLSCRYNGSHKLVFLEVARLLLSEVAAISGKVFECGSDCLGIARVDFAVDVPGIPAECFRQHMRATRKQTFKEVKEETKEGGRTLYYGRGQDFIRVYDKRAELHRRDRLDEFTNPNPDFRDLSQHEDLTLTRVERQIRSGRIPGELANFELLRMNAATFNPFSPVRMFPGGRPELPARHYPTTRLLEGIGLRTLILELGLAETWKLISENSGGNANRVFERSTDFLPPAPTAWRSLDLSAL